MPTMFDNIGFDPLGSSKPKSRKKKSKKKKRKSKKTRTKRISRGSDIGIPTIQEIQPSIRQATPSERRKARKKAPKGSRVVGIDTSDNSFIMSSSDVGDPLEMKSLSKSSLNTDISKVNMDSEFEFNLGDTGFGLKQKDLNKKAKLDKKPLTELTFKTPFGNIKQTQIPISDEKGDPMRNKKGVVIAETVTETENVNPAISFIGQGIKGLNTKIQTQIQKEKDKRERDLLIEKAVKASQKPNNPNEEYCVQVTDRDTGNTTQTCYSSKALAERAIQRARSEGLLAVKV